MAVTSPSDEQRGLERARRRVMLRRLPLFGLAWLGTTLVWVAVLVLESRLGSRGALLVIALQLALLVATLVAGYRLKSPAAVICTVVAGCMALGGSTIAVFVVAGGHADFLAFILLTLYLASSLFFGWGWRPAFALLAVTVAGWLLVLPRLTAHVPPPELVGAILVGSVLSLAIAEGYARSFSAAFHHERERDVIRARERAALAEAERARAEAEEATRAKDRFLAIVSHDLRAPLTATLTWSHVLRHRCLDEADVTRALDGVERSVRMSVRLIEELMDVSRIAAGKLHVEMGDVDLRGVVAAVAESSRLAAHQKGVALEVEVPDAPLPLQGDSVRLVQVLENLLSNALKFTPEGGHVIVNVHRQSGNIELIVRDTGIGIPGDLLPHVFEPFRQADSERTRRHGGLGLGLAIVRHLVEAHGGTIEVDSAGEGGGATFVVRFPDAETRSARST